MSDNNNVKTEVQKEVKQDVQAYTRLRPPNIKIENSRWNLDLNEKIASGEMTPLPKLATFPKVAPIPFPLQIPIPVLNRSIQPVVDGYIDSDIESDV
jgi:hypothetical protein